MMTLELTPEESVELFCAIECRITRIECMIVGCEGRDDPEDVEAVEYYTQVKEMLKSIQNRLV